MKRVSKLYVGVALIVSLLLLFAGCGAAATATPAPAPTQAPAATATPAPAAEATAAPEAGKKARIGYISAGTQFYYACQESGVRKRAKELGFDLIVLNSEQKAEKELSNMEDLLRQKVDLVIMQTQNSAAGQKAVELANKANIPVILLSTQIEAGAGKPLSQVLTDFKEMGRVAGRWAAANVPEGEVAIVEGLPGMSVAEDLTAGFKEAAAANPKLEVVGAQPADWDRQKAMDVTTNFLQSYPNLKLIYTQNDDMSMGTIKAIEQAGKKPGVDVLVVSDNGSPEGAQAIRDGILAASVAGQSPAVAEGVRGIDVAADYLAGKKIPEVLWLDLWMLTKDNLNKSMPWCFDES